MFDDDVDEMIRAWRRRGMGMEMGGGCDNGDRGGVDGAGWEGRREYPWPSLIASRRLCRTNASRCRFMTGGVGERQGPGGPGGHEGEMACAFRSRAVMAISHSKVGQGC